MDLRTFTVVIAITIPFFLLTMWAIVDALQKDFGTIGKKALWGIVAAVPFVGAVVYLLFGFRKGKKPEAA